MFPVANLLRQYVPDGTGGGGTTADDAEALEITKIEENNRTPAQKRIVQLVSQRKAAEARADQLKVESDARVAAAEAKAKDADDKLAAKDAAEKAKNDAAELAAAKTAEDFTKIQARLQKERDDEKVSYEQKLTAQQAAWDKKESDRKAVAADRAAQSILHALAVTNKMTDPADIDLFDAEVDIDPDTLELTVDGKKKLDAEFAKFKKAKSHLFGGRVPVPPTDNHRSRRVAEDGTQTRKPSPMELIAEGLRKQAGS